MSPKSWRGFAGFPLGFLENLCGRPWIIRQRCFTITLVTLLCQWTEDCMRSTNHRCKNVFYVFYFKINKKALLTWRAARDSAPWWIGIQYRHLAENCAFFIGLPLSYSAPPLHIFPVEFRGEVKRQETRVMGLLCGEGCVILTSTVFDWSTRVTDRQTDRRTDGRWHIAR